LHPSHSLEEKLLWQCRKRHTTLPGVPCTTIAAPGHSYWGDGFTVLGRKAFLEIKLGARREIT